MGPGAAGEVSGDGLADARVAIREGDVARVIRSEPSAYDVILLDVDDRPDGLTRETNDGLYNVAGLRAAWTALRAGRHFGHLVGRP